MTRFCFHRCGSARRGNFLPLRVIPDTVAYELIIQTVLAPPTSSLDALLIFCSLTLASSALPPHDFLADRHEVRL